MLWAFNKNRNLQQVQQLLKAQRQRGSYVNESDFDFLDVGKPNTIALALESNAPVSAREGAFAEPTPINQGPTNPQQTTNSTAHLTDTLSTGSSGLQAGQPDTLSQAATADEPVNQAIEQTEQKTDHRL
jgi:hypothetical protein